MKEDQLEVMHQREFDLEDKMFQANSLIKKLQVIIIIAAR